MELSTGTSQRFLFEHLEIRENLVITYWFEKNLKIGSKLLLFYFKIWLFFRTAKRYNYFNTPSFSNGQINSDNICVPSQVKNGSLRSLFTKSCSLTNEQLWTLNLPCLHRSQSSCRLAVDLPLGVTVVVADGDGEPAVVGANDVHVQAIAAAGNNSIKLFYNFWFHLLTF